MKVNQKGLYVLWHPDSPGTRVWVIPGILRRLGLRRSEFATSREVAQFHRFAWVERDYTRPNPNLGYRSYLK